MGGVPPVVIVTVAWSKAPGYPSSNLGAVFV